MTPTLTAEQLELRDSFHSFLAERAPISVARKKLDEPGGSTPALWNTLMELGVLSYFSESVDAGGGTARDLGLLAAEAGYGLLTENLIDAALIAHLLCTRASNEDKTALRAQLGESILTELSSGAIRAALAIPSTGLTEAHVKEKERTVSGSARFVSCADSARLLLLPDIKTGRVWLCDLHDKTAPGDPADCLDRTQSRAAISFKDIACTKISSVTAEEVDQLYRALIAAELSGTARRALELTVDYVKTREQFDVPIGGFQAVQHAAADMMVKVEAIAALADFACWCCDASPDQSKLAALSAGLFGFEEAPKVIEKAIQLHGGIGFTWEHDLHLLLRRARTIAALIAPRPETYESLLAAAEQS